MSGRSSPLDWIARRWADQSLTVKGLVVIAVPLFVLLGALLSLYVASLTEAEAEDDVRATFAIQRDIHEVHALLAEAASGVRGYLLTGQDSFLEPYVTAEAELPRTLDRLDSAIRDPEIRRRFARLQGLVERKREGLAYLLDVEGAGRPGTLDRPEVLAALVANKAVLDGLRQEIRLMQIREAELLRERRERADAVRSRNIALTAVSAGVGVLGAVLAVLLFVTGIVRRVHLLEANATRLQRGEVLEPLPAEADEIGHLARRLDEASALLRAREQALRDGEERLRLVIEGVRDYGIFALDTAGHVTSWNAGAQRIKGYAAEDIIGEHFSRFYPEETRQTLPRLMLDRAIADGRSEDEGWRVRKDGTRFWASVVITALRDETGALRGFSKVTRDISDRHAAEEALHAARREAEAASQAKSEFLSRMSHELRTPLNAILGFAQLLEMDASSLDADQERATHQILKAGRHLLGLIDEVLDISRIEAGRLPLTLETLEATRLAQEAVDLSRPMADAAGVEIDLVLPAAGPPGWITADRRRTIQVLLNLLSNAIKYNRPRGRIEVALEATVEAVTIRVTDEGPGIPEDLAERLFRPFERLGRDDRAGVEGTGLGLALSKRLVEAMGGDIRFANRTEASGAVFSLTLPRAQDAEEPLARPAEAPPQAPAERRGGALVLSIEDNLSNVALIESALAKARPTTTLISAMQGRLGLDLARRQSPDLILLDLDLPDMHGSAVLEALKADAAVAAPVVVISADAMPATEARLLKAGAARYLTKPIDMPRFLMLLDELLPETAGETP